MFGGVRNIKIKDDESDADSKIGEHNLNGMFNHMGMDAGLALDYPATARYTKDENAAKPLETKRT